MESLYELIKTYGTGKGEATMWKSVKVISDSVEKHMDEDARDELNRHIFAEMSGGHYDQHFAMEDVRCMYYTDESGEKHYAPYWTPEQVSGVYEKVKREIPEYNMWDFYVTLQMVKADNCPMLKRWFPEAPEEEMTQRVVELAVNWLKDEDWAGSTKIWDYLNK